MFHSSSENIQQEESLGQREVRSGLRERRCLRFAASYEHEVRYERSGQTFEPAPFSYEEERAGVSPEPRHIALEPLVVFYQHTHEGRVFKVAGERSAREKPSAAVRVCDGEAVCAVRGLNQYIVGRMNLFEGDLFYRYACFLWYLESVDGGAVRSKGFPAPGAEPGVGSSEDVTGRASSLQIKYSLVGNHKAQR